MVTKSKPAKKQLKIRKLKLNKETVQDLSAKDAKKIKGGAGVAIGPQHKTVCDFTLNTQSPSCIACPNP